MRNLFTKHIAVFTPGLVRLSVLLILVTTALYSTGDAQAPGQRNFDITAITAFNIPNQIADGTSNGITWKICSTTFSSCCGQSITNGYQGFNTGNFSPPLANADAMHIGGTDFTITFERPVGSIVFYLRENGGNSSVDFGIAPVVISGAANLTIVGTRIYPNTLGGAIRLNNVNSRTLTGLAGVFDSMNIAFYVESLAAGAAIAPGCQVAAVPALSQWSLIILGLLVLCFGAVFVRLRKGRKVAVVLVKD